MSVQDVLKNYLNNIVYIDDEFKLTWVSQDDTLVSKPKKSSRYVTQDDMNKDTVTSVEMLPGDSMERFCIYMQKQFPQILLCPIKYSSDTQTDTLIKQIKNGKLVILDWSLAERFTAIDLLKAAKIEEQLKLFVIYTSKLSNAKSSFITEFSPKNEFISKSYGSLSYEYTIVNSCVYMFCEKGKFNFEQIIDAYSQLFVEEYGYFPIAFIDMITRIEERTSFYLEKFSRPFDSLLLLQTNSDQMSIDDIGQELNRMVINNLKQDINLNVDILKSIYQHQIVTLLRIVDEADFGDKLKKAIDSLFAKLHDYEKIDSKLVNMVDIETFKDIIKKAVSDRENLYKSIEKASKKLSKEIAKLMVGNFCTKNSIDLNVLDQKVINELIDFREKSVLEDIRTIFPLFLILLVYPDSNVCPDSNLTMNNLIMSLKTMRYDDASCELKDILQGCYEDENGRLKLRSEKLLENKLYSGDIVFGKNDQGEITECWLCIVPPCHMLRPKKVNCIIQFVRGEILKEYPDGKIKDSEHITLIPHPKKDNEILCVKWMYHNIASIDLKQMEMEKLESFTRPYRLMDEYIRQIMGQFTSFYSKVGVEELFIKSSKALADAFLSH